MARSISDLERLARRQHVGVTAHDPLAELGETREKE